MTAKRYNVGKYIQMGMTTDQIRTVMETFPKEPHVTYFMTNLGYKESTAKKYLRQLKQNNLRGKVLQNFIVSENADPNNLLIDASVVESSDGMQLIAGSKKVSILSLTIQELDNIKARIHRNGVTTAKEKTKYRALNDFGKKMLLDPRFKLIELEKKAGEYVDDLLIQYLSSLPKNNRPTLITSDVFLSVKAKAKDIEYMLCLDMETESGEKNTELVEWQIDQFNKSKQADLVSSSIHVAGTEFTKRFSAVTIDKSKSKSLLYRILSNGQMIEVNEVKLMIPAKDFDVMLVNQISNRNIFEIVHVNLDEFGNFIIEKAHMEKEKVLAMSIERMYVPYMQVVNC